MAEAGGRIRPGAKRCLCTSPVKGALFLDAGVSVPAATAIGETMAEAV